MYFRFRCNTRYLLFFFILFSVVSTFYVPQVLAEKVNVKKSSDTVFQKSNELQGVFSFTQNEKDGTRLAVGKPEAILHQIWKERFQLLVDLTLASSTVEKNVMENAQDLNSVLQEEKKEFNRLLRLHQAAYNHPIEQMVLVYRMKQLYEKVTATSSPLLQLSTSNSNRVSEITRLKKEIADSEQLSIGLSEASESFEHDTLKKYKQELVRAEKSLSDSSARISLLLAPVSDLGLKLSKTVELIESNLQTVWLEYYTAPISFLEINSENVFSTNTSKIDTSFSDASFFNFRLSIPEERHEFIYSGRNFLLCFAIFIGMACWVYKKTATLPPQWRTASQHILKRSWIYIALGSAFIAASTSNLGEVYFSFAFLGSLLFILGIGLLSWKLRSVEKHSLINSPSPFLQMYPPFVLGVLCIYLDLPLRVLGITWLILMVCFIFRISALHKKYQGNHVFPMLEALLYRGISLFSTFSLVTVIAGYPRLAVLVFLLFFAVVYVMTLLCSCKAFLTLLIEKQFRKNIQPIYNVIAHSVITPITLFTLAVISLFPWQWAVPGASSLLQKIITQSYTLGAANISFSHFIVLILLFFVFRSIIAIGNKSLSHLPEKISHIEQGVIPPLKTLWTYGAWTVFVLISLSLLEVSLTSLAVVAGGLSVGIGFGMQNIFNNLVSGLLLIFGRSILVGDTVEIGSVTGKVLDISIRCITIETKELSLLYVPNSALMSGQFTNCTRNSRVVQRSFTLGVAYGTDPTLVSQLFFEAVNFQDKIVKDPLPSIRLENFGESSLDFAITVRIEDLSSASDVLSQLKKDLLRLLTENAIELPFPQLDIHVQKEQKNRESGGALSDVQRIIKAE